MHIENLKRVTEQIARKFAPKRIVLFGSYAYGRPDRDSDVDLQVVMDSSMRNVEQAVEIRYPGVTAAKDDADKCWHILVRVRDLVRAELVAKEER